MLPAPRPNAIAMRLVIQIPCLDEALTLPATIRDLPSSLPGIEDIRVVVVDDGSSDGTCDVAAALGATVVRLPRTRGLAAAFAAGVESALASGADIVVNTDGDNQYRGSDVALLIAPIVDGAADIVIGARPIATMQNFSPMKKLLQRIGSWVVRHLSGTSVPDATSGFRAYSREAALVLDVFSGYTHTLETIVQGAHRGLRIASVPIGVNPPARDSRLMRSTAHYVMRAGSGLLRMFVVLPARTPPTAVPGVPFVTPPPGAPPVALLPLTVQAVIVMIPALFTPP